jgi:sulfur-carrier protein adenylyltransferase/sulfurtransferase
VLGVVPGQIGLVQATEVIKLVLDIGTPMIGKFYVYNALTLTTKIMEVGRDLDCPLCGDKRGEEERGKEQEMKRMRGETFLQKSFSPHPSSKNS